MIRSLAAAGRMTLTIYVLHALVFNLVVHVLGWVAPDRPGHRMAVHRGVLAAGDRRRRLVAATLRASAPLERVYRRFGGDRVAGDGIRAEPARAGQRSERDAELGERASH